jgi:hypothetical protein
MSRDNLLSTPSPSTPKKVRTQLQSRITNLAVPIRLHIYGFLNKYDIHIPVIYGRDRNYGDEVDPCWDKQLDPRFLKPYTIETAFSAMMGDCEVLQYLQGMPSNLLTVEYLNNEAMYTEDIKHFFYLLNILIVGYNNIKTLRFARQMLFPWNRWALDAGIRYGVDLTILKWMQREGCTYSDSTFGVAASWRNTDVLDWLLSIDCPMSGRSFDMAISENCKLGNLTWLRSHGCPLVYSSLKTAMTHNDNLVIFKYLLQEKRLLHRRSILRFVIINGNVSHLKLFHEANVIFEESHFLLAIKHHRKNEIMQYLLKCLFTVWDTNAFSLAVKGGNLSILMWLREEGCPWDVSVFITAIKTGNRDVIRWLYEEKCPTNETAMNYLMTKFVYNRYDSDDGATDDDDAIYESNLHLYYDSDDIIETESSEKYDENESYDEIESFNENETDDENESYEDEIAN